MPDLRFAYGNGRLLRTATAIVFVETADDDLLDLFLDGHHVDFKELAAHVVAGGFGSPPFVVIDLVDAKAFVFGDLEVQSGADVLSGSASSTWHEGPLNVSDAISVGAVDSLSDGRLELGWVSARAFRFASPASEFQADEASPKHAHDDVIDDVESMEPAEEMLESAAATASIDIPQRTAPVIAPPQPSPVPTVPAEMAPQPDADFDDDWDPLADPEVDLERIGAQELIEDVAATTFQPSNEPPRSGETIADAGHDEFVPDDTVDHLSDPRATGSLLPQPAASPPPPAPGATPLHAPSAHVAPLPPPPPIVPIGETNSAPTLPAPTQFRDAPPAGDVRATLRFDDGQSAEVRGGVYVGRHPTKGGVPQNYDSVTIRGEHVSRVHWEFALEDDQAIVRDLGSNSGTEVEINGRRVRVPDGGMHVSPGAKVCFADRWAIYETE